MKKYLNRFVTYLYFKLNPEQSWLGAAARVRAFPSSRSRLSNGLSPNVYVNRSANPSIAHNTPIAQVLQPLKDMAHQEWQINNPYVAPLERPEMKQILEDNHKLLLRKLGK